MVLAYEESVVEEKVTAAPSLSLVHSETVVDVTEEIPSVSVAPIQNTASGKSDEQDTFSRIAIGGVTGFLFLCAWGVVALCMYIIFRVATGQGLAPALAVAVALPVTVVPIWKSIAIFRAASLERTLLGHIWVLNGAVLSALPIVGGLWLLDMVRQSTNGEQAGTLIGMATLGFPFLFGFLAAVNWWTLGRRR